MQLPQNKINHIGVFASDCLPSYILPSTAIVVNTDPHTESGEHWVVLYLDQEAKSNARERCIEYFDSFGRPPYQADFQKFLRHNSHRPFKYNKYRIQGFNTSVCGHYCLTYLYCRLHYGMTMNDFVQLFDVDENSTNTFNDACIQELFNTFYL